MFVVQRIVIVLIGIVLFGAGQLSAQEIQAADLPLRKAPQYKDMLPLSFSLQSQCSFGDMNALVLDMNPKRSEEVLLTIEKFGTGGTLQDSSIHVLSDKQVMTEAHANHRFKLHLPQQADDGLYGIYICKVSKGESRRCNDKKPANIQQILGRYALTTQKRRFQIHMMHEDVKQQRAAAGYEDKFYYFKPIAVIDGQAYILDELMSDGLYDKYRSHLAEHGIETDVVDSIQFYDRQLGNMPLQNRGDRVHITMPVYHKGTCNRRS